MSTTYEDKRAELRAIAEGGTSGRDAYREGRQRIVSDNRAALDRALGGQPVAFEDGTAAALESIIRPTGDTALARYDTAADRFGTSQDLLGTALDRALAQQGAARDLNYDRTLADGRLSTDRSMELAQIQRDQQRAREEAAEAEAFSSLPKWQQEALAEGLGTQLQDEARRAEVDYQDPEFKRELSRISGRAFAHINDPKERQALLAKVLAAGDAGDTDTILDLIDTYAPESREEFDGLLTGPMLNFVDDATKSTEEKLSEFFTGLSSPFLGTPEARREADLTSIINDVAALRDEQAQRLRAIDADRYRFNQDAYVGLGGDPLLAAGLFPQSFDQVADTLDAQDSAGTYIATGLYGSQYEDWLKQEEERVETEQDRIRFDIATGAGTSHTVVDKVLERLAEDPTTVYELLADTNGAAVVSGALEEAAGWYEDGMSNADVKRGVTRRVQEKAEEVDLGEYGDVLAAIVREQYDAIYG